MSDMNVYTHYKLLKSLLKSYPNSTFKKNKTKYKEVGIILKKKREKNKFASKFRAIGCYQTYLKCKLI